MDSLSALICRASLLPLARTKGSVPSNLLYMFSTINDLFSFFSFEAAEPNKEHLAVQIKEMLNTWDSERASLRQRSTVVSPSESFIPGKWTILLTGSTGSLGSQILGKLLESPNVARILCLNRSVASDPGFGRQRKYMDNPALLEISCSKVTFAPMNVGRECLGLSEEVREVVRGSVAVHYQAFMSDGSRLNMTSHITSIARGTSTSTIL